MALILGFTAVIIPTKADALGVRPFTKEVIGEAGVRHEFEVEVSNQSSFIELVSFKVRAFTAGETEGVPEFTDDSETLPVRWFQVPQQEISLEPQETKKIPITITVPPDANPGGYYAAVFARTRPPENAIIASANEVGILHFITVEGDMKITKEIKEFTATPKTIIGFPVELSFMLENTGSIHTTPQGIISVTNIFTGAQDFVTINEDFHKILPNSQRTIRQYWNANNKWYDALSPLSIGLYEAELQLNGYQGEVLTSRFIIYTPLLWIFFLPLFGWMIIQKRKK